MEKKYIVADEECEWLPWKAFNNPTVMKDQEKIREELAKNFNVDIHPESFIAFQARIYLGNKDEKGYLKIGRNKGFIENTYELSSLKPEKNKLSQILIEKKTVSVSLVLALIALLLFIIL